MDERRARCYALVVFAAATSPANRHHSEAQTFPKLFGNVAFAPCILEGSIELVTLRELFKTSLIEPQLTMTRIFLLRAIAVFVNPVAGQVGFKLLKDLVAFSGATFANKPQEELVFSFAPTMIPSILAFQWHQSIQVFEKDTFSSCLFSK